MKIANKIFENVLKLKYFATILTKKNYFYEEIRSRLNMEMHAPVRFRIFVVSSSV